MKKTASVSICLGFAFAATAASADESISEAAKGFAGKYGVEACENYPSDEKQPTELTISVSESINDKGEKFESLQMQNNSGSFFGPLQFSAWNHSERTRDSDPTECSYSYGKVEAKNRSLKIVSKEASSFCIPPIPPALIIFTGADTKEITITPRADSGNTYKLKYRRVDKSSDPKTVTEFGCDIFRMP